MNINELYGLVRNGDKAAEKQLFDILRERFRLITQQKVKDAEEAEDILQDTVIVIARKYLNIDFEISFSAWAYKVLENNILNYYRTNRHNRDKLENISERDSDSTAIVPDSELKRRLLNCLKKINEANIKHARILNFSYQGFDMQQICERLKLTRNGAYILLSRARAKLKICLEKGL